MLHLQSQTDVLAADSHPHVLQDAATSPLPWQPAESLDKEEVDTTFTALKPLPRYVLNVVSAVLNACTVSVR
jgi:hypothetical protein